MFRTASAAFAWHLPLSQCTFLVEADEMTRSAWAAPELAKSCMPAAAMHTASRRGKCPAILPITPPILGDYMPSPERHKQYALVLGEEVDLQGAAKQSCQKVQFIVV